MDRYQRVGKSDLDAPLSDNEIRITTKGKLRNYITYAIALLQEKGESEIVLKGMGRAINKAVTIAEILKRRVHGIHQITAVSSADIVDKWEPLEEGLLPMETTRHVSMISIRLSTKQLDTTSIGYQPPLPADQVKPLAEVDDDGEDSPQDGGNKEKSQDKGTDVEGALTPSKGRGRGRRFRSRARGNRGSGFQQDGKEGTQPVAEGKASSGRGGVLGVRRKGRRGRGQAAKAQKVV